MDASGAYVELDRIHFVKVQNALQADGRWLGELSTEVCGALDVPPDPSISGDLDLIVIRDLPREITSREYPMEVFVFHQGRMTEKEELVWVSSSEKVTVDEDFVLRASESGDVTLTAYLSSKPHIQRSLQARIRLDQTTGQAHSRDKGTFLLVPNPAQDQVQLRGARGASLRFFSPEGKLLREVEHYNGEELDIRSFPPGMYVLWMYKDSLLQGMKLIKE